MNPELPQLRTDASEPTLPAALLKTLAEALPSPAIFLDRDRAIPNAAAASMTGRRGNLTVDDLYRSLFGDQAEKAQRRHRRLAGDAPHAIWNETILHQNGTRKWVRIVVVRADEGPELWLFHDALNEELAVAALRESEARMRAILNATHDAIVTTDRKGTILAINPATVEMFGYPAEELLGRNVSLFMPATHRHDYHEHLSQSPGRRLPRLLRIGGEVRGLRKDGTTFPLELTVKPTESRDQYIGIMRDISQRRDLEQQAINAVMAERMNTARDLHDGIGSMLTAIHLRTDLLARKIAASGSDEAPEVYELSALIKQVLEHVRSIAHGLRAVGDHPEDLAKSLAELVKQSRRATVLKFGFHHPKPVQVPDPIAANHLFRIAQEAVTNAIKYCEGAKIRVSLSRNSRELVLAVTDDGKGINPENGRCGSGLTIMEYRCNAIGGVFDVSARHPRGTRVTCRVPIGDEIPAKEGTDPGCRTVTNSDNVSD
jgi:two-component system sensor kinase FixL